MKKVLCVLCLALVVTLGGCKDKDNEVKETKIEIKTNDVYTAPVKPTDAQAKLYNKLTKALNEGNDEEIAKLVAQNFISDFYTFKNKSNSQDIGGLTYLPEARREEFKTYATIYAYSNYETIIQKNGKSSLPVVKSVKVDGIEAGEFDYTNYIPADEAAGTVEQYITDTFEGFQISVSLSYEDSKLAEEDLLTKATILVLNFDGKYCVVSME